MNKKTIVLIMVLAVTMVTMTFAQGRGRNRAANPVHTFDVTAPADITGKIVKVETVSNGTGRYGTGIHLTVESNGTQIPVRLGPSGYFNTNNWEFKEGQEIKVRAYKGTGNDNGMWFAAEINSSGQQLTVRDKNGIAMWSRSMNGGNNRNYRMGGQRGCRRFSNR
jgi:hypothetical protein